MVKFKYILFILGCICSSYSGYWIVPKFSYDDYKSSSVIIFGPKPYTGYGSGFLLPIKVDGTDSNLIVTAYHCVQPHLIDREKGLKFLIIRDGHKSYAQLVAFDSTKDIAALYSEDPSFHYDISRLKLAHYTLPLGSPICHSGTIPVDFRTFRFEKIISKGCIGSNRLSYEGKGLRISNVAFIHGCSGGPIIDNSYFGEGNVVGMLQYGLIGDNFNMYLESDQLVEFVESNKLEKMTKEELYGRMSRF